MADINLDEKKNPYDNENSSVEVSKDICKEFDSFEKVTYKITYKQEYPSPSSWYWFWQWRPFYLYIKFRTTRTPFTYYPNERKHVINEVEVYYSRNHPGIPLILGFKRDEPADFTYYTFLFLKHQSYHTGFPSTGNFYSDQLEAKLKQENDKRNKIKFVTRKFGSVDYDEKEDHLSFNDYMKCTYSPKDDEKNGDYEFSADSLFKKEAKIYVDSSFFNELNDHKFEFISVYYTKTSKIALLVEFINGSGKKFFARRDINGTYWSEKTISHDKSSELENYLKDIKGKFENCIAYQLDKTSNDQFYKSDYISVSSYSHSGFKVVTHTPSRNLKSKSPFVLLGKSLLELDKTQKITGSKLDDIHKKTYNNINVNYYNSSTQGKNVNINVPFFLELIEKSNDKRYYLLRLDKKGVKWKEVDNASVSVSDPSKKLFMIRHIDYYSNRSIMVIINYKGIIINQYILHSVENLFNKDDQIIKHSSANIIIEQRGTLSGSIYKYCEHRFFHPRTLNGDDNSLFSMAGLRLYVSDPSNGSIDHGNSIEIKTYDSNGSVREILYNESNGKKTNLYVYFRGQTNIPLLVQHDDTFYKPYSREQYFEKWVQVADLKGSKPEDRDAIENIKNKLNEINTNLNDIDISKTNVGGYGIKNKGQTQQGKEYHELTNKTFSGKRIDVQQKNNNYIKVIHSTSDKTKMGEIKYGDKHLQNELQKNLSTVVNSDQYNTVAVHYHTRDSGYLMPLLIKISSSTITSSLFYERTTKESNFNWKKIRDTSKLQSDGLDLENKINTIHYNLTNSLKIQLEKHEKASYSIKLVKNLESSDIQLDCDCGNVNVLNDVTSQESKYTSYKHTIDYSQSNEPKDLGGIRLYIYDNEISTYSNNANDKCPIYYDPSIKEVYVYFCGSNKVPILVCYNNKYYRPNSRDQYFQKWVLKTDITLETQLQSKLDEINKVLNEIDISETKHNTKYGIPKLGKETHGLDEEFYTRVSVTTCKSKHFRKVTHTTTNGFIGTVMYGLKPINISPVDANHETNKLCLYYDSKDKYFTKPLLIKICSSTNTDICHWYSRTSTDILNWKNEGENDEYNSCYNLEKQLKLIGELFVRLLVPIDKQGTEYNIIATKGNDSTSSNYLAQISLNTMTTRDSITVNSYRFYYHSLSNYYQDNKESIISKLGLLDKSDLELELVIQIFDRTITLVDSNERPLNPALTFTKTDSDQARVLFVYFYESEGLSNYQRDQIPLLIYYRTSFYAPFSKDSYFKKWKKVFELSDLHPNTLLGSQAVTNGLHQGNQDPERMKTEILKKELDKINQMLNEIHTSKQEDYGLPFCGKPFYNRRGGPNSKRITVKKHKNDNYVMYVHTTFNGYEIGSINTGSTKLDYHKKENGNKSIELAAIFENKDLSDPEILLVNEKKAYGGGSITHGYYYKSNNKKPFNYKFTKLKYGCDLMNKLKGLNVNECDFDGDFSDIKGILNKIITKPLKLEPIQQLDLDMGECKDESDIEFKLERCPEIFPLKPQVLQEDGRQPSSGNSDSSKAQQHQSPHQQPFTPVASSIPAPQPQASGPSTSESSGKDPVVIEGGNLQQDVQSPGLEKEGGSTPEVSPGPNSEAVLFPSENGLESPRLSTTDRGQEREITLGSTEAIEELPARESSSEVQITHKGEKAELGPSSEEETKAQIESRSSDTEEPTSGGGLYSTSKEEDEVSGDGSDSKAGFDSPGRSELKTQKGLSQQTRNEVAVSSYDNSNGRVGTGGSSQTEKESPTDMGEQIKKFIGDHKEAVYGGGASLVTVGGGAYPAYRVITNIITK